MKSYYCTGSGLNPRDRRLYSRTLDPQRTPDPMKHINRQEPSQRPPWQHSDQAPRKHQQAAVLNATHQTFSKIGAQHCTWADRLPQAITSPQTIKHHYRTWHCSRKRSGSIYQDTGLPNQEIFTRHWPNPSYGGKTPQLRGTVTFQSAEERSQTQ